MLFRSGQSSSSTSTTTSSIPSTPSVDRDVLQPTAEGQESTTDYDEDWDNEDWGSIDGDENSSSGTQTKRNTDMAIGRPAESERSSKKAQDGWDDWAVEEEVIAVAVFSIVVL